MQKLRKIDPTKIMVPDLRVTARFDEEAQRQFEASVHDTGIDEPIKCYQVGDQIILSDGLHRLQRALAEHMPTIEVYVREGTMEEVLCNNLMSGHLRGKHPVSEMVKVIKALWQEYKWDSDQIAKKTGLTRDYVEKLQLISELTPLAQECLDDGRIKVGHASALTKLKDPIQQETVLRQSMLYNWPVRELETYIGDVLKLLEAPPAPGQPAAPRQPVKIKCAYCGDEYEPQFIANPNTCQSCSGTMFAAMAAARQEAADQLRAAGAVSRTPPPPA